MNLEEIMNKKGLTHIVPISGGKDSCTTAIRLKELYPHIDFIYVCTPTGDELPEMERHWVKLEKKLGKKIIHLQEETLYDLIEDFMMMPNWQSRFCTRILKIEAIQEFYNQHKPAVIYVGLRADEKKRKGNRLFDEDIIQIHPMQEWGWGLKEVLNYLKSKDIKIPRRTDCAICFFQRIDEWYSLWEQYPRIWRKAEDLEFLVGHSLLSPGKWNGIWPEWLFEMRCEFEKGRIPTEVKWTRKKIKRIKKVPMLWPEDLPEDYDYGTRKKCRVCSL